MPGAVWRPITIPGGNPGARTKGRAVVLHVAASEATSLFGFFNNNPNANSHFYVNRAGVIEQYVDTDLQAWASMAANKNTISVETQGGVTNADAEPWNDAQVAALGRICAWAHATEGTPLVPMTNSLPTSRGIGYHRLGVKPWVVAGGETWSSSTGKLCPGAAKIAQIPAVIAAALSGGDTFMGLTFNNIAEFQQAVNRAVLCMTPSDRSGSWLWDKVATVADQGQQVHDKMLATTTAPATPAAGAIDLYGHLLNVESMLAGLSTNPVTVDAAEVAAALAADTAAMDNLAAAIAAQIATRLGNG